MTEALKPEREADVVEAVLAARLGGTKLDIVGGGAMAGLGRPRAERRQLSSAAMSGIIFYAPAEMTLSASAGTTVAAIEAAIAEHGQMLPFEPMRPRALWGSDAEPTLGGMVATNLAGPRRPSVGAVRDGVLGLKLVNGLAQTIRCGGRVMKNVTGLDLTKLNCGAHGTLGVLTEATIKLAPKPEAETTLVMPDLGEVKGGRSHDPRLKLAVRRQRRGLARLGHGAGIFAHPAAPRRLRRLGRRSRRPARVAGRRLRPGQQGDGRRIRRALALGSRRRIHRRAQRSRGLAGKSRSLAGGGVRRRPRRNRARPFL